MAHWGDPCGRPSWRPAAAGRDKPVPYGARANVAGIAVDSQGRPLWSPVLATRRRGTGQARPLRSPRQRRGNRRWLAGATLVVARPGDPPPRDGTSPSPTEPAPTSRESPLARRGDPRGRPSWRPAAAGRDKPVPYGARANVAGVAFGSSGRPSWSPVLATRRRGTGQARPLRSPRQRRGSRLWLVGATLVVARPSDPPAAGRDKPVPYGAAPTSRESPLARRGDPCGRPSW